MKTTFYIANHNYLDSKDLINIENIPPLLRRRLSLLDKTALTTLNKAYKDNIKSIIFSSKEGELSRLIEIISQFNKDNEVSPNYFSASVHNYITGFFTSLHKLNIPYMATSSGENSLSAGLLQSILSKNNPLIYCYADINESIKSVSCIISKVEIKGAIKCSFERICSDSTNDEFKDFIKFLENKTNTFSTLYGRIKRFE